MSWKRIINQTTLTGIGSWIFAVVPLFQPDSKGDVKMTPISWTLAIMGTALIFWGVFRKERVLTPKDAIALMNDRQKLLPEIKNNIIDKTKQLESVRDIAAKIPMKEYIDKYLRASKKYKEEYLKHPNVLITSKIFVNFIAKTIYYNPYFEDLKNNDDKLNTLNSSYYLLLSQLKDKKLKRKLGEYWKNLDLDNSRIIYEQICYSSKPPISLTRRKAMNTIEKIHTRITRMTTITEIMSRIDELLDGQPDE